MKLQLYFVLFSVIFYSCSERKVYNQSEISDYERSKIELLNEYGLVSWDTLRYTYQLQEYSIKNSGIIPIEGKLSDLMMMTDSSFILKINSTLKQKTEYACLISLGYADFKVIKHYLENRDTKKRGFFIIHIEDGIWTEDLKKYDEELHPVGISLRGELKDFCLDGHSRVGTERSTSNASITNCSSLPVTFSNYNDAIQNVLNAEFKTVDHLPLGKSSWITKAHYYSCDSFSGYLIIETATQKYIHSRVPIRVWREFKNATSSGSYYDYQIRGRYRLILD